MRVLIVDDSRLMRQLMQAALTGDVLAVESGVQALDAARTFNPEVILLDSEMPGMNGGATLEALQGDAHTRPIPVIMVTANDRPEARAEFERLGAVGVIEKPFAVAGLQGAVADLLVVSH